jgi:hypothetical protein
VRTCSTLRFPAVLSAAALMLGACSSPLSNNALGLMPASAIVQHSAARPAHFAAYAKVVFHNNYFERVTVKTLFSYPILPTWHGYKEGCVDARSVWESQVPFNYPKGQVRILVVRDRCSGNIGTPRGSIDFKDIKYSHGDPEEATIASNVEPFNFELKLCGHQTQPTKGYAECTYIPEHGEKVR